MKCSNQVTFLLKSMVGILLVYVLFTRFNVDQESDLLSLLRHQILNPFSAKEPGAFHFVKLVSILGLSFNSFYYLLTMAADSSEGAREVIRYHSRTVVSYYWALTRLVASYYIREYLVLIGSILAVYFYLFQQLPLSYELLFLLLSWLMVDMVVSIWITLFSPSPVFTLLFFSVLVVVRYFLLDYDYLFVIALAILFCFNMTKERRC